MGIFKENGIYKGPGLYKPGASGGGGGSSDVIGGKKYRTVQIGSQIWLAENLDFRFTDCNIAGSLTNTPYANYYNGDYNQYSLNGTKKCGLLYNWEAVKFIDDNKDIMCPGWHVPTLDEFNDLFTHCGGTSMSGAALKAKDHSITSSFPNGFNGNDTYEFGALPSGTYYGTYDGVDFYSGYWTIDEENANNSYRIYFGANSTGVTINSSAKTFYNSLRLIKD